MEKTNSKKVAVFQICSVVMILSLIVVAAAYTGRRIDQSYARICVSNMKQIQMAKEAWAAEQSTVPDIEPTWQDLMPYLPSKGRLKCPYRKEYDLGPVTNQPVCPYGRDHVYE